MSQRNPLNERYTREEHTGASRKSAASAKPKAKAAASVTIQSSKDKTPQQKKAARKQEQRREQEKQRDLDRKYYKPDTERYKTLRRYWWLSLGAAIVMVLISWFTRSIEPAWISFVALILAYVFIIFAFYLDFAKIRKERSAYQQRMYKIDQEAEKKQRKANRGKTTEEDNVEESEPKKGILSGLFKKKTPASDSAVQSENDAAGEAEKNN